MNSGNVIGQTLDDKYRIESEIGKGGMGTVYLATHVGTERPVALKVIAPQFMQRLEFVERFKREARAAGRLRHPNVVNVTDFGFTDTKDGKVAYLVMEYLDGCTLGEVLEEEGRLPLSWTLDILEQVCSAVQEAHEQGIIHRDLKPDNIWLEPNQRGGYTVKVLDFGIAKLEEQMNKANQTPLLDSVFPPTQNFQARPTIADNSLSETIAENYHATSVGEAATIAQSFQNDTEAGTLIQSKDADFEQRTLIQPDKIDSESGTAILPVAPIRTFRQTGNDGTKLNSKSIETDDVLRETASTSELTRVGAVLGTPLYMSPEQCRGEKLTAGSDIYSLGVIAYQMLSGKTPFSGEYQKVMEAHQEIEPPVLEAKKVPRKVKNVINFSLAKTVESRPPTAQSFASELRAQSEGIGALLRRSLTIYSEHLPKFMGLTLLLLTPFIFVSILKFAVGLFYAGGVIGNMAISTLNLILLLPATFVGIFCSQLITGTTTWIVIQYLAIPLRPISLRTALRATRKKWKRLIGTGLLSTALTFLGLLFCFIGFPILSVLFVLVAPVVMMEDLRWTAALKRSKNLTLRSLRTTIAAVFIMFLVPMIFGGIVSLVVALTVKTVSDAKDKMMPVITSEQKSDKSVQTKQNDDDDFNISFGPNENIKVFDNDKKKEENSVKEIIREGLTTVLILPMQILLFPLSSIIIALLYLKTRQVGGESMNDLLAQFEESDQPRTNWQRRVQKRLEQSGRITGKSKSGAEI